MALKDYGTNVATTIFLDPKRSYACAYDQAYIDCPEVFPVVQIPLVSNRPMQAIADSVRKTQGIEVSPDADYRFSIGIQNYTDTGIDSSITVEILDPDDDGLQPIFIDLSEDEQVSIRMLLEACAIHFYGNTLQELLQIAAREIPKDVVDTCGIMM